MPLLQDLLYTAGVTRASGSLQQDIQQVVFDSRQARAGVVFVAVKGHSNDGHSYLAQVINAGCTCLVVQDWPADYEQALPDGLTVVQVTDSAKALGIMAANFYGNPSKELTVVAVTGTNGKTTVATLLYKLFRSLGYGTGLISTVQNMVNEEVIPSTHTTPDAVQLQALLSKMLAAGCSHVFMEASSHAIHQQRMAGLMLAGAVFTNLSHDHLDYHGTFDNYLKAKKALFDQLPKDAFALSNADDKRGAVMLQNTKARRFTYSLQNVADYKARLMADGLHGLQLEIAGQEVWFRLIGKFNAYNLLAVFGVAEQLGEPQAQVLRHLSALEPAPGRFDRIIASNRVTYIVDYAHTPDAVENVLETITALRTRNETVITLLGCGGNRDSAKRPVMAATALKYTDLLVMTSDNPRDEDPDTILDDMAKGVSPSNFRKTKRILDRAEAIAFAVSQAQPGDIVLIAGKGHENYQEIKGVKHPFDDKEVLREALLTAGLCVL